MRKRDELMTANSCISKANDDEMIFVLIGRDPAGPAAIRFWIAERIRLGKNREGDDQTEEAEECAKIMEGEQAFKTGGQGWALNAKALDFGDDS